MNNNRVRFGIAAIVVAAAALAGARFLAPNVGTSPTTTPMPSPSPTPTPAIPVLGVAPDGVGPLAPGQYVLATSPRVLIEVTSGWEGSDGLISKGSTRIDGGIGMWEATGLIVYDDPCRWATSAQSHPTTLDDIAAALAAQQTRAASEPDALTVGGMPARHVHLTVPADIAFQPSAQGDPWFPGCDQGEFRSWDTTTGAARYHQGPGQIDDMYVVDLGERIVIVDAAYFPDLPASDQAALHAMVDSVTFPET